MRIHPGRDRAKPERSIECCFMVRAIELGEAVNVEKCRPRNRKIGKLAKSGPSENNKPLTMFVTSQGAEMRLVSFPHPGCEQWEL